MAKKIIKVSSSPNFSKEWLEQICAEARSITYEALKNKPMFRFCLGGSASLHALLPLLGQYGELATGDKPSYVHPNFASFINQVGAKMMLSALPAAMELFPSWVVERDPFSVYDIGVALRRFVIVAKAFDDVGAKLTFELRGEHMTATSPGPRAAEGNELLPKKFVNSVAQLALSPYVSKLPEYIDFGGDLSAWRKCEEQSRS